MAIRDFGKIQIFNNIKIKENFQEKKEKKEEKVIHFILSYI